MPVERTFALITYGCTLNASDSQVIRGVLDRDGWNEVNDVKTSSLVIVNTCGVKVPTEQKILHRIGEISVSNPGKPLIIAGCLPVIYKGDPARFLAVAPSLGAMIGPRNYHELGNAASRVLAGERHLAYLDGKTLDEKACLETKRDATHVAILPISEGCLGACHYCCTRFARGPMQSYRARVIRQKLQEYLGTGVKETWITAEDCAAYKDEETGMDLAGLLDMLSGVDGEHVVRIGMMNPRTLLPILPRLSRLVADRPRIFKFIHVPVQSGSDKILEAMNRGYTSNDFINIIDTFKAAVPGITIATDVICGYPGETDDDYQDTIALIEQVKPDILNISAYGHRPGTLASKLPSLPTRVVKERTRCLATRHHAITWAIARSWIGWKGLAIISEFNQDRGTWVARNVHYRPVVLQQGTFGARVEVEITDARRHYLIGKITGTAPPA